MGQGLVEHRKQAVGGACSLYCASPQTAEQQAPKKNKALQQVAHVAEEPRRGFESDDTASEAVKKRVAAKGQGSFRTKPNRGKNKTATQFYN
ncbi:hypothetical protein [Hymenobacter properus]|uniref:Uncharacterized protein n=1 Tax=Hymenobacter properus TaxID=2791026 RepID=A0A931BCZ5_9BACT|nr:hypothetical protein [Hymenobacter properus]MBF9141534.1 hypothetical protein [Hymenobacter properus]MBR7720343.1 hypothetical protein [Microvirga sp. SRT04]